METAALWGEARELWEGCRHTNIVITAAGSLRGSIVGRVWERGVSAGRGPLSVDQQDPNEPPTAPVSFSYWGVQPGRLDLPLGFPSLSGNRKTIRIGGFFLLVVWPPASLSLHVRSSSPLPLSVNRLWLGFRNIFAHLHRITTVLQCPYHKTYRMQQLMKVIWHCEGLIASFAPNSKVARPLLIRYKEKRPCKRVVKCSCH